MGTRLLKTGDYYAVYANGIPVGNIHKDTNIKRMWRAESMDGREGIFPHKRIAADWLAQKEY